MNDQSARLKAARDMVVTFGRHRHQKLGNTPPYFWWELLGRHKTHPELAAAAEILLAEQEQP